MKTGTSSEIQVHDTNYCMVGIDSTESGYAHHDHSIPWLAPPLVTGIHKYLIGSIIKLHIVAIAFSYYLRPAKVMHVMKRLEFLRQQYMGKFKIKKLFKVDGRYYWDMHAPGWPSPAFVRYNENEMNRIAPFKKSPVALNSMILAITKKCPLQCRHCYEWDVLNERESLSLDDLKAIISKFQDHCNIAQIQLSGGEPLSRYSELVELLESSRAGTDFWLVTSGYNLTYERAKELKKSGLLGIAISLDHFDPVKHNHFRGSKDSFYRVMQAIKNSHQANLLVILSLCPTKEFISAHNLDRYALMAKRLGVAFILMIEPRAVGRYAVKDISISIEQEQILEDFYLRMNFDPLFRDMPAVSYHGYHQRRVGCFGNGNRYIYIDTEGNAHACPFCRQHYGNVLKDAPDNILRSMTNKGCRKYKHAEI